VIGLLLAVEPSATAEPQPAPTDQRTNAQPDLSATTPQRGIVPAAARRRAVRATIVTANIPYTLSAHRARAHLRRVLSHSPDVVTLQEVRTRPLRRWVRTMPGRWKVIQVMHGTASMEASAIIFDARRFRVRQRGLALGFHGRRYDRWIIWAILRSPRADLAVASLHLPPDSSRHARSLRSYRAMARRTRGLGRTLRRAGYPVVMGGDWNGALDRPLKPWGPVRNLRRAGLTTNWLHGRPCKASTIGGGKIDGFGYNRTRVRVERQGCLRAGRSDHRPVWMRVRVR
jgi:endonuclease/exonuclease/phosphatase family metal-dependent hydrolase